MWRTQDSYRVAGKFPPGMDGPLKYFSKGSDMDRFSFGKRKLQW